MSDRQARQSRLLDLFTQACDLSADAQRRLVARLRREDPTLADELADLLACDDGEAGDDVAGLVDLDDLAGVFQAATAGRAPPLPEIPGHRCLAELGEGGAGRVVLAEQVPTGRRVALKVLHAERTERSQVLRFRREFRAIARLRHPCVVEAIEEGEHAGRRWFTMEHVGAGDLRDLAGATETDRLSAVVQVAAALDYVHGQRLVHRDLKLANVLLARRGPPRVKLVDFGIVRELGEAGGDLTGAGTLLGTVDTMSPEQARGGSVDPRADLYALGCMIFRLWSGEAPFHGDAYTRLMARLDVPAPDLRTVCEGVSPALARLTARLLATDPTDRPQSALEVATELVELLRERDATAARALLAELPALAGASFLYQPELVGRAREQAAAARMVREAARGGDAPALVVIVGAAGSGRTTLAHAVRRELAREGAAWHRARADARRPFGPFEDVAAEIVRRSARRGRAVDPWDPGWMPPGSPDRAVVARRRRAEQLASGLLDLSADPATPYLQILEDLDEADDGAWALLEDLIEHLRGAEGPRPGLLATVRAGEARLEPLIAAGHVAVVELGELDADEVAAMAGSMMGERPERLPAGLVRGALERSGGNPAAVRAWLQDLVEAGALRRRERGWELSDVASLDGRSRVAGLTDAGRDVMAHAAVIGAAFDVELLLAIAGRPEVAVLDAVDEALRAGLVSEDEDELERDGYRFTRADALEELAGGLDEGERARLHGRIEAALGRRPEVPVGVRAEHAARGDDATRAVEVLVEAADQARRAYDVESDERWLRLALERASEAGTPRDVARELEERRADALLALVRGGDAAALLTGLLTNGQGDRLSRARWLRKLGRAHLLDNDTATGVTRLREALALLGDPAARTRLGVRWRILRDFALWGLRRALRRRPRPDPVALERARIHRELGFLYRWVDLERMAAHGAAYLRLTERLGDESLRADALSSLSAVLTFVGLQRLASKMDARAERLATHAGDREGLARMEVMRAASRLLIEGDAAGAAEGLDRGIALAEALGDRFLRGFAVTGRGWGRVFEGRWEQAIADFERGRALANELNLQWMRADAQSGQGFAELMLGRLDDAERTARAILATGASLGLPALEALATEILGGVSFMRADYAPAAERFARARSIYERHKLSTGWGFMINLELGEAICWGADTVGPTPGMVRRLRRCAKMARRQVARLAFFRGFDLALRGVAAARAGHVGRAERLFEAALAARGGRRRTYLDGWLRTRIAVERRRLHGPSEAAEAELDEVEVILEEASMPGMRAWLHGAREATRYEPAD